MKLKLIITVLLALAITLFAGCAARDRSGEESVNPQSNEIESSTTEIRRDEEPVDELSREEEPSRDPSEGHDKEAVEDEPAWEPEDNNEQSAQAVMSTDYEEIASLSAEKVTWGPGLNTDADKRPVEAVGLQAKYSGLGAMFIAPNNNKIYLTFDEGYENNFTGDILDTLKEKNVKAVFFVTYHYAKTEPELMRRMVEEGHVLGNHSTKHKSFPTLSLEEAKEDIMTLHDYVKTNYGYAMTLFRPPMGEFSEQTLALAKSLGYSSVFWSFAYRDWDPDDQPISIQALDTINTRCHPGAILLLHAVSRTNAEILGEAIDTLQVRGFEFARMDWL